MSYVCRDILGIKQQFPHQVMVEGRLTFLLPHLQHPGNIQIK